MRTRGIEAIAHAIHEWLALRGKWAPGSKKAVVALFRKEAKRTEKVKTIDEAVCGLLAEGVIGRIKPRRGEKSPGISLRSDYYSPIQTHTN